MPAPREPSNRGAASESELVVALRAAQSAARDGFERLYAGAVPALVAWTRLRVAGLPPGRVEVDEVVQETCVRALENFGRFTERASFRSWAIGIAQKVLLEMMRRDGRVRSAPLHSDGRSHLSQVPDSVTTVSRAVARDDGFARMVAWIFELPSEDRELLLLHALEERPLASVAERLHVSEEAVAKRWQRLRARLQEQPLFISVLEG